ncbi:hypothetical protein Poli38472_003776 [Pythium oligandrum]|uniref:Uncharacterized protein n=1 Tax=Pythium oligandrum TaxID=41045 RepID=A0A8K1CNS8_PYTOL|nr:hypothetical protein Poli38472_003776 [Pythium oligandrum]|eukprot:TMW66011.1 hypothetical protein Poli38472_003776 [Pythium oligandrum]
MTTSASRNVWFITGCSSGIGRQIAIAARSHGDLVIASARKIETLDELKTLGCEVLTLDITASEDEVKQVIDRAHAIYGRIDIVMNNAGSARISAVEEASDKDVLALFDGNVFGHLRVVRAVLPHLREKRSGIIAFIGSVTGYSPITMNGVYGAAKFALAGISQTLAQEVAHLGIEVTVIEPGVFPTNGLVNLALLPNPIADYDPLKSEFHEYLTSTIKAPPSDTVKGAQAIVEALTKTGRCAGKALPRRMPLGGDVLPVMEAELALREKEKNDWVEFTKPETFSFEP